MRPLACLLPLLALAAACGGASGAGPTPRDGAAAGKRAVSAEDLALANNAFALDLYRALAAREGNLFFSPMSIEVALAMSLAGARGETADEMRAVSRLPAGGEAFHDGVATWQRSLLPSVGDSLVTLTVANRLWGQEGIDFGQPFLELTRVHYGAALGRVDFAGDPTGAARTINDWVAQQTHDRITDLVPPGALGPATRLVLANAIYFLGTWAETFPRRATREEPFATARGGVVPAPMMKQVGSFPYAETSAAQVLELSYETDGSPELSLVVILPRAHDGLAALTAALEADTLATWLGRLSPREVDVRLPRFETSSTLSLADALARLGMPRAFSDFADFSGMLPAGARERLALSDVLHKGWVKVDEEGTVAAAATGMVYGITSVMEAPDAVVFNADHPFLFLIRERSSGTMLFLGRLEDPRPAG